MQCPDCGALMMLRPGRFGPFYACVRRDQTGCPGAHGAHPDGRPMGTPANAATRQARIKAHAAFDQLWKSGEMTRRQAYWWLQQSMEMTTLQAHIGKFTLEQCERLIALVEQSSVRMVQ